MFLHQSQHAYLFKKITIAQQFSRSFLIYKISFFPWFRLTTSVIPLTSYPPGSLYPNSNSLPSLTINKRTHTQSSHLHQCFLYFLFAKLLGINWLRICPRTSDSFCLCLLTSRYYNKHTIKCFTYLIAGNLPPEVKYCCASVVHWMRTLARIASFCVVLLVLVLAPPLLLIQLEHWSAEPSAVLFKL